MKTTIKTITAGFILTASVFAANASEILNNATVVAKATEYELKIESWMVDESNFKSKTSEEPSGSVVEIAVSNPDFSILVEAVTKAGLADNLSASGPFTVFAPTNDAFNALFKQLGVGGIKDLSAEQLTPILTYHVVSGRVMSTDLSNTSVATLNGKKIIIDISNGVKINESKVVKADIQGTNGVVHVIDRVLIPN